MLRRSLVEIKYPLTTPHRSFARYRNKVTNVTNDSKNIESIRRVIKPRITNSDRRKTLKEMEAEDLEYARFVDHLASIMYQSQSKYDNPNNK